MGQHFEACTIYAKEAIYKYRSRSWEILLKHWRGTPPWRSKNLPFGVNISWTEAKFKIRLGGVNWIEITYRMIPYTTMWLWRHELQGGCYTVFVIFTLYSTCVCCVFLGWRWRWIYLQRHPWRSCPFQLVTILLLSPSLVSSTVFLSLLTDTLLPFISDNFSIP